MLTQKTTDDLANDEKTKVLIRDLKNKEEGAQEIMRALDKEIEGETRGGEKNEGIA